MPKTKSNYRAISYEAVLALAAKSRAAADHVRKSEGKPGYRSAVRDLRAANAAFNETFRHWNTGTPPRGLTSRERREDARQWQQAFATPVRSTTTPA
jgi:hypothetical protein